MAESAENRPMQGFDIALVTGKLKGWELATTSDEQGIRTWIFDRVTTDGKHLVLGINPLKGFVNFREHNKGGVDFSISCEDVGYVDLGPSDILEDIITFRGGVRYRVELGGMSHQVFLPYAETPLVTRTYDFEETF